MNYYFSDQRLLVSLVRQPTCLEHFYIVASGLSLNLQSLWTIKRLWHKPPLHAAICGRSVGVGLWAEHGRVDLPYRAGRHLCAVTSAPARQRFPGRELPSPMLTARRPESFLSPPIHPTALTALITTWNEPLFPVPPGPIALFSIWCIIFQLFPAFWHMDATLSGRPLNQDYISEHFGASGRLHNTGWQAKTGASRGLAQHLCVVVQCEHYNARHSNCNYLYNDNNDNNNLQPH